jgi:chromosome segregation ATPase
MERQRETYEELLAKYKIQLSDKQQQLIEIESHIQEVNETVESMEEQLSSKQNLVDANEKRVEDLKKDIEISNTEYIEREQRLEALTEKLHQVEIDHGKLVKAKEAIEISTNDSKTIFLQLKEELENQEKEIRDKESRIHRLKVLSAIYRASKFFGGILIGFGIFCLIWAAGIFVNIIDLGEPNINSSLIVIFLLIGAILSILSGIFHLEKS